MATVPPEQPADQPASQRFTFLNRLKQIDQSKLLSPAGVRQHYLEIYYDVLNQQQPFRTALSTLYQLLVAAISPDPGWSQIPDVQRTIRQSPVVRALPRQPHALLDHLLKRALRETWNGNRSLAYQLANQLTAEGLRIWAKRQVFKLTDDLPVSHIELGEDDPILDGVYDLIYSFDVAYEKGAGEPNLIAAPQLGARFRPETVIEPSFRYDVETDSPGMIRRLVARLPVAWRQTALDRIREIEQAAKNAGYRVLAPHECEPEQMGTRALRLYFAAFAKLPWIEIRKREDPEDYLITRQAIQQGVQHWARILDVKLPPRPHGSTRGKHRKARP